MSSRDLYLIRYDMCSSKILYLYDILSCDYLCFPASTVFTLPQSLSPRMSSDLSGRPLGAWYGGIYVGEVDGGVYIHIIIRPKSSLVYDPYYL